MEKLTKYVWSDGYEVLVLNIKGENVLNGWFNCEKRGYYELDENTTLYHLRPKSYLDEEPNISWTDKTINKTFKITYNKKAHAWEFIKGQPKT